MSVRTEGSSPLDRSLFETQRITQADHRIRAHPPTLAAIPVSIVARLNDIVEILTEQSNGLCGELRITAPVSLTQRWLGEVIGRFAARTRACMSRWRLTTACSI